MTCALFPTPFSGFDHVRVQRPLGKKRVTDSQRVDLRVLDLDEKVSDHAPLLLGVRHSGKGFVNLSAASIR